MICGIDNGEEDIVAPLSLFLRFACHGNRSRVSNIFWSDHLQARLVIRRLKVPSQERFYVIGERAVIADGLLSGCLQDTGVKAHGYRLSHGPPLKLPAPLRTYIEIRLQAEALIRPYFRAEILGLCRLSYDRQGVIVTPLRTITGIS
jgi:hypothetical protein